LTPEEVDGDDTDDDDDDDDDEVEDSDEAGNTQNCMLKKVPY